MEGYETFETTLHMPKKKIKLCYNTFLSMYMYENL